MRRTFEEYAINEDQQWDDVTQLVLKVLKDHGYTGEKLQQAKANDMPDTLNRLLTPYIQAGHISPEHGPILQDMIARSSENDEYTNWIDRLEGREPSYNNTWGSRRRDPDPNPDWTPGAPSTPETPVDAEAAPEESPEKSPEGLAMPPSGGGGYKTPNPQQLAQLPGVQEIIKSLQTHWPGDALKTLMDSMTDDKWKSWLAFYSKADSPEVKQAMQSFGDNAHAFANTIKYAIDPNAPGRPIGSQDWESWRKGRESYRDPETAAQEKPMPPSAYPRAKIDVGPEAEKAKQDWERRRREKEAQRPPNMSSRGTTSTQTGYPATAT